MSKQKEQKLKELIRKKIRSKVKENKVYKNEEAVFRKLIKHLIKEAAGDDPDAPTSAKKHLVQVINDILTDLEKGYMSLESGYSQRESFKKHIVKYILDRLTILDSQRISANAKETELDSIDTERSDIDDMSSDKTPDIQMKEANNNKEMIDDHPKGINVDTATADDPFGSKEPEEPEEPEEELEEEPISNSDNPFPTIPGLDKTGRGEADLVYARIIDKITGPYNNLAVSQEYGERDAEIFKDFLITNLLLYFDTWEETFSNTFPDLSTPEYEKHTADKEKYIDNEENPLAEEILSKLKEMKIV